MITSCRSYIEKTQMLQTDVLVGLEWKALAAVVQRTRIKLYPQELLESLGQPLGVHDLIRFEKITNLVYVPAQQFSMKQALCLTLAY